MNKFDRILMMTGFLAITIALSVNNKPEIIEVIKEVPVIVEVEKQPEPAPEPIIEKKEPRKVVRLKGPRWSFERMGTNPPISFMRKHLESAHNIDTDGLTADQLKAIHDNIHNYGRNRAYGS